MGKKDPASFEAFQLVSCATHCAIASHISKLNGDRDGSLFSTKVE